MEDGSIIVSSKIETDGVETGADDLKDILRSIISTSESLRASIDGLSEAFGKGFRVVQDGAREAVKDVEKLSKEEAYAKKQAEDLANLKIHRPEEVPEIVDEQPRVVESTGNYGYNQEALRFIEESTAAVDNLKGKAGELKKQLKELESAGKYFDNSDDYQDTYLELQNVNGQITEYKKSLNELAYGNKMDQLEKEISELEGKTRNLTEETHLYELQLKRISMQGGGFGSEEYDKVYQSLQKAKAAEKEYRKSLLETEPAEEKTVKSGKKMSAVGKSIANVYKKGTKTLFSFVKGCENVGTAAVKFARKLLTFKKSNDATNISLSKSIKTLLKYGIGIRSLFVLSNKIRNAGAEGLQNLVQYSAEANAGMSMLMSSMTRLKNSFATAFAPILSVVAPIISSFIDMLSRGATYVGMFFAAITGKDTFTQAKAVQQDYAAALDKTAQSSKKAAEATKDAAKAAEGSLAPWDELTVIQFDAADAADSVSNVDTPEVSELTPQDMFEEVPIKNSIKDFADQIKKLIKDQDWNGIGKFLGQQINKGLKKLNKTIRWDNVGDDITKGVDAITGIFNSMVDEIDWEYMGDTAGEGLNTFFKTLNQLMEKTDWKNLGKGFAEFANGLMDTVEWDEVGKFFGNKFMLLWDTLNGTVHELHWEDIGASAAEALNAVFKRISLSDVADTLTTAINGAFQSLAQFTKDFDWDEFADNVGSGISDFLEDIEWEENGKALGSFLSHLCTALKGAITKDTFYELGKGIGDFLGELPWKELLETAAQLLIDGFGGLMSGLAETPAGLFADALFVALTGAALISKLKGAFAVLFGSAASKGAEEAAGGLTKSGGWLKFLSAIGIGGVIGMKATEVTLSDEDVLPDTENMLQGFSNVLDDLKEKGTLSESVFSDLKEKMEAISTETSPVETIETLRDLLSDAKVSSDDLALSISDTDVNLDSLFVSLRDSESVIAGAADQTKSFDEAVKNASTSSLIDQLDSLQDGVDQLSFAQMIIDSTNTIDQMKGIWENGRQILGEKAIAIHDEIVNKGLEPDKDGFYKLASGQMVQYGNGIADYEETLKGQAKKTLDSALSAGISEILPEQMDMGWDIGGYFIDGYAGAFTDKTDEIRKVYDDALKKVDTTEPEKKGKDVGEKALAGMQVGLLKSADLLKNTTKDVITDSVIDPAKTALDINSPSGVFEDFAIYCGIGFSGKLESAFSSSFQFFRNLGSRISDSIGDLGYIGRNTVIGINNGMVSAADSLFENVRKIAENIANTFRNVLQIHSPSRLAKQLGSFWMQGFPIGMQGSMDKVLSLAESFSEALQKKMQFEVPAVNVPVAFNTVTSGVYPKQIPYMAQGTVIPPKADISQAKKSSGEQSVAMLEQLLSKLLGTSENRERADGMVGAFQEALEGMQVVFGDNLIGHLQKEDTEYRNRTGRGIFEG